MKLLIAIATCHAYRYLGYHADTPGGGRVKIIRETWKTLVPQGVDFKFFYGRPNDASTPKDDEVFLDVSDAFHAMPGKIQAIFRYAIEHGYDYVLECTDDVFVNVPNLLRARGELEQYDYVGNALNLGNSVVPFKFVSGFAVWYSRRAMEFVARAQCANYADFNIDEYRRSDNVGKVKWHDDLWVGSVLSSNGITAQNDERFIIEIWTDIGNGPPSTFPLEKAIAVHVSPHLEHMRNLMPVPFVKKSNVTMVLTSCDRHALLKQTLDSFMKCTDVRMDETIIVEDSTTPRPAWLTDNYSTKLGSIVWLQNPKRMGQIYSIDRAYAEVRTDYIFHCEDDWAFRRGDFITKSKAILDKYPKVILIALSNLPRGPYEGHFRCGMAMTFNPGLRRLSDYKAIGNYKDHCKFANPEAEILRRRAEKKQATCDFISPETEIANLYAGLGFVVGHLGQPCVIHIGDDHSTFGVAHVINVSVVMTTFNRPQQLKRTLESIGQQEFRMNQVIETIVVDDGTDAESRGICETSGATYIKMNRPQSQSYRNPAVPNNVGIRNAKGDIVILQNAECCHIDPATIQKLAAATTDSNVVFAKVIALNPDGTVQQPYCSPQLPRPYFFCGAIKRKWLEKLRGFDEDYVNAGYDDDDMAARLRKEGLEFVFSDIEVHHQYHAPAGTGNTDFGPSLALYNRKCAEMNAGTIGTTRNIGREWGDGGTIVTTEKKQIPPRPGRVLRPTPPAVRPAVAKLALVMVTGDLASFRNFQVNAQKFEPHTRKVLVYSGAQEIGNADGWQIISGSGNYLDDLNLAVDTVAPDDVLFCTPSLRFTAHQTSVWLQSVAKKNRRIGVLSPKVQGGAGVQGHPILQPHLSTNPWSVVTSASLDPLCLFMLRDVLRYFTKIEDPDLSRAVKNIGLICAVTPHKTVTHA